MTAIANHYGLTIPRTFSREGENPFDSVLWNVRDTQITGSNGDTVFGQKSVHAPEPWSQTAINIVASKYLHGPLGTREREGGVDAMISRVVSTIARWGREGGYFQSQEDAAAFEDDLACLMLHQFAAFNSPVWFNVGCDRLEPEARGGSWHWNDLGPDFAGKPGVVYENDGYRHPQCSACFINSVEDSMESVLSLAKTEGMLFKWGSGTGSNLSRIRGSMETLSGGGTASGPLSFMRGFDAFAGAIKSGGKTRRAAKMVILDADHPDIGEFIRCKGKEEAKAHALVAAGYDGSTPDSEAYSSIFFQNANNSVRVTDEFMRQVVEGLEGGWSLTARTDGAVLKTVTARNLLRQIAEETWRCGDPGMQFDTTINRWHTSKTSGRINASNPCSEYMFLDDSACNLASLNLVKFQKEDGSFDTGKLRAAVRILIIAMDILVDGSGYPTERIASNSHDYRPLGLGFANLGALLIQSGIAYDSDEGRGLAAATAAIMGGQAYLTSAELAQAMPPIVPANPDLNMPGSASLQTGACPGFARNRQWFSTVMDMHRAAACRLPSREGYPAAPLSEVAREVWTQAVEKGHEYGYRNSQVTVIAPTGTIAFMMDCDSTGIEPLIGLIAYKKLVGGGHVTLTNDSVAIGLRRLGYGPAEVEALCTAVKERGTIEGAPELREEHLAVFDCALKPSRGTRSIAWEGHLRMMAAVQPFVSGAISKTINMPSESTVEDIMEAYIESWRLGLKAVAIYRDGSKSSQPVTLSKVSEAPADHRDPPDGPPRALRHRLPDVRQSLTNHFRIANHEGYLTVGLYPNGGPGELFIKMNKEGSTISGLMDTIGVLSSLCLQYGVPLEVMCAKLAHMRFEPSGWTGNEQLGYAKSVVDYIFRFLELRFLTGEQLPMFSQAALEPRAKPRGNMDGTESITDLIEFGDAPTCVECGCPMSRSGTCYRCPSCGSTSGGCS